MSHDMLHEAGLAAMRTTVILTAAALLCRVMRRSSAAARHVVWSVALVGALVSPMISWVLPPLQVAWTPRTSAISRAHPMSVSAIGPTSEQPGPTTPPPAMRSILERLPRHSVVRTSVGVATRVAAVDASLITLWLVGTLCALIHLTVGMVQVRSWRRVARPLTTTGRRQVEAACARLRLTRSPQVFEAAPSSAVVVPMTWGVLRPVVLLPAGAGQWPEERLTPVLLHEISHVKRLDWLLQISSQIVCALYWWHPAVWLAARQARVESERACDDRVLETGVPASEYAAMLVEFVRSLRPQRLAHRARIAMADRTHIEVRLSAILTPTVNRRPASAALIAASVSIATVGLIPLSTLAIAPQTTLASRPIGPAGANPYTVQADPRHKDALLWKIWAHPKLGRPGTQALRGVTALLFQRGSARIEVRAPLARADAGAGVFSGSGGVDIKSHTHPGIEMTADNMTWDARSGHLTASGHVHVANRRTGSFLQSDSVTWDLATSSVSTTGRSWFQVGLSDKNVGPQNVSIAIKPGPASGVTNSLRGKVIVIDPGHGGRDNGAVGAGGVREKDVNLALAEALRAEMEARGATILLTRESDADLTPAERSEIADAHRADYFVSVHCGDPEPLVFYHGAVEVDRRLAATIQQALNKGGGTSASIQSDEVLFPTGFGVLRGAAMPAVLIECGSLTQGPDLLRLTSAGGRQLIAKAIADGLTAAESEPQTGR